MKILTYKQIPMKPTVFMLLLLILCSLYSTAQKADFKAAEKFRADNLASRDGDLSVNAD
jgi:hypothetical protein